MKPEEFISFAGQIAARMADEPDCAAIRTVASRSYYGAFHMALDVLRELQCAPLGDSHGNVRDMLSATGNDAAIDAASALRDMHGARIKADYRLSDTRIETSKFAMLSVETANDFMSQLNDLKHACANSAVKQQIVDSIRKYCATAKIPLQQ
jgi:hypothetical protein